MPGKKGILRRMVDASLAEPGGTVAEVIFGAVPGGEKTLRKLAIELLSRYTDVDRKEKFYGAGEVVPIEDAHAARHGHRHPRRPADGQGPPGENTPGAGPRSTPPGC